MALDFAPHKRKHSAHNHHWKEYFEAPQELFHINLHLNLNLVHHLKNFLKLNYFHIDCLSISSEFFWISD